MLFSEKIGKNTTFSWVSRLSDDNWDVDDGLRPPKGFNKK